MENYCGSVQPPATTIPPVSEDYRDHMKTTTTLPPVQERYATAPQPQSIQNQPPEHFSPQPQYQPPPTEHFSPQPQENFSPQPQENFKPEQNSTTPLQFGTMAGGEYFEEPFKISDYEILKNYDAGSQNIPVYNEADGQIGLPVPDMTDISAGENNKYVYDRTIGTIGFTSTKIGGRRRGQSDYIRGDLAIIPDKNSHFQVSADPLNSLMEGAMNASNGIGGNYSEELDLGSSVQMALNNSGDGSETVGMDKLRELSFAQSLKDLRTEVIASQPFSGTGSNRAQVPRSVIDKKVNSALNKAYKKTQYGSFLPPTKTSGGTLKNLTVRQLQEAQLISNLADNKNMRPVSTYGYTKQ